MHEVLWPAVRDALHEKKAAGNGELFKLVSGMAEIEAAYEVDQSPIGKTSRSTPATYIKVFDEIRNLYAQLPVARVRGYSASRFSFNAEGGRCEACKGQGVIKLEMSFLPRSYVPCEDCGGRRYNPQTLEVLYNEKSIGDVMDMTIEEAAEFFSAYQKVARPLSLLVETGLGYLKLGQPSPTLSGGEAQRLKLVTQLKRGIGRAQHEKIRKMRKPGSTLYLLEEPTIGLHMADIELLLNVVHALVDEGNTVIVIEHNLSVIAEADYVVDIGPEAGAEGGRDRGLWHAGRSRAKPAEPDRAIPAGSAQDGGNEAKRWLRDVCCRSRAKAYRGVCARMQHKVVSSRACEDGEGPHTIVLITRT